MENQKNPTIYTTKTDLKISRYSREQMLKDYEIVYVNTSGKDSGFYQVLDTKVLSRVVLSSVRVQKGRENYSYYYLLKKEENKEDAQDMLDRAIQSRRRKMKAGKEKEEEVTGAVRMTDCMGIPDDSLMTLLLKAVKNDSLEEPERSDIGGGPYLYCQNGEKEDEKEEVITLYYYFDKKGVLHQDVKTFIPLSRSFNKNKGRGKGQPSRKGAVYRFETESRTMCREYDPKEGEELYVLKKRDATERNTIPWFSFPSDVLAKDIDDEKRKERLKYWKEFENTRNMQLIKLRKEFNKLYGKYGITIEFLGYEQTGAVNTDAETTERNRDAIHKALDGVEVYVVNTDAECEADAKKMVAVLEEIKTTKYMEYSGIHVQLSAEPVPCRLNIIMIHNPEYYAARHAEDPHGNYLLYQHVTYETWKEHWQSRKSIAKVCLLCAKIRQDIQNKHVSLFDCSILRDIMYFVMAIDNQILPQYVAMRLEPSGDMAIATQREIAEFEKCFPGFRHEWFDGNEAGENIEFAVRMGGNVNLISNTGIRTVVDPEKAEKALSPEYRIDRKRETLENVLTGLVGIRSFQMDGRKCYVSGMKSDGVNMEIPRASLVREVTLVEGTQDLTCDLLPLMCVEFVRLNQLTVKPFPIKYMREFLEMSEETVNNI